MSTHGSENSFTGRVGERFGKEVSSSHKMTPERCAHLTAVAVSHNLMEAWISRHPLLLFAYIAQYMPTIFKILGNKGAQSRINGYKSGVDNINSGFFSSLLGSKKKKEN